MATNTSLGRAKAILAGVEGLGHRGRQHGQPCAANVLKDAGFTCREFGLDPFAVFTLNDSVPHMTPVQRRDYVIAYLHDCLL